MKESTGSLASLYIIIFFVTIIIGFFMTTLSYYKSYKVNNSITSIIEDNGGFHYNSLLLIEKKLLNYGYNINNEIKCEKPDESKELLLSLKWKKVKGLKTSATSDELGYKGFCIYLVNDALGSIEDIDSGTIKESNIRFQYYHYRITTYMRMDFGIFDIDVPYRFSSTTSTMYNCYGMPDSECRFAGDIS